MAWPGDDMCNVHRIYDRSEFLWCYCVAILQENHETRGRGIMLVWEITDLNRKLLNRLLKCTKEFIEETRYPITFCELAARKSLTNAVNNDDGSLILVMDGDEVMGGAIVYAVSDWQVERFGYIEKFFVRSKYRARGVGRLLARGCTKWFDERGCVLSFATATANIGQTRQFQNLMSKYGYRDCGATLTRKISNGQV